MNFYRFIIVLRGVKGGKMQDISDLLKEAKPLYFARKKRNKQIKVVLASVACAMFVFAFLLQNQISENPVYWDLGDQESEVKTYVENLGLPVDDYGLLLVS